MLILFIVTLEADPGVNFRGFLLQARLAADDISPRGTFEVIDDRSRLSDCTPTEVCFLPHRGIIC